MLRFAPDVPVPERSRLKAGHLVVLLALLEEPQSSRSLQQSLGLTARQFSATLHELEDARLTCVAAGGVRGGRRSHVRCLHLTPQGYAALMAELASFLMRVPRRA